MANVLIEPSVEVIESEEQIVYLWRREQFDRLGFDQVDSRLLAESPADLGLARRLRSSGCSVDLAFRILAEPSDGDGPDARPARAAARPLRPGDDRRDPRR